MSRKFHSMENFQAHCGTMCKRVKSSLLVVSDKTRSGPSGYWWTFIIIIMASNNGHSPSQKDVLIQLNCKTKCLIDCQLNGLRLYRFIDRFHRLNYCPTKMIDSQIEIHSILLIKYDSYHMSHIVYLTCHEITLKAHSWIRYKIPIPFKLRFKHLTMVPLPMIPMTAAADADIA